MVFECVEFLQLIGVILRIQLFGLTDSSLPVRVARTGTVQMKPVASFFFGFLAERVADNNIIIDHNSLFWGGGGSNSGASHVLVSHL